jgi:hypothetical protein
MWPGTGNPENNLTTGCSDSEFIVMYVLPIALIGNASETRL